MPIYEYACTDCDHHFDVRHGADEKPALCCPQCQGNVRKVFHAAGIIFKGSGWYVTDNAAKNNGNGGNNSSDGNGGNGSNGGNDSNGGEKKEAAPAAKTESKTPAPVAAAESKA